MTGLQQKTRDLIDQMHGLLEELNPMTVRQVFYRLVSKQVLENDASSYGRVSRVLVLAREKNMIPWAWIEDRTRHPHKVSMWDGLSDFAETAVGAYRRNVWEDQPNYFEFWLEKDALSGIFAEELRRYGVTFSVGRGFDSATAAYNAAQRLPDDATVVYFGDFDSSGESMNESLQARFSRYGTKATVVKVAILREDIEQYDLPPDFAKKTDTRTKKFIAKHGDNVVELDALPVNVLRERIVQNVEARMDLGALEETRRIEQVERGRLMALLGNGSDDD